MTRTFLWAGLIVSTTIVAAQLPNPEEHPEAKAEAPPTKINSQNPEPRQTSDLSGDEKLIHDNIVAFVSAYNAGNSSAVADLFTADAQIITEVGETIEGREAIAQEFENVFDETPDVQMEIFLDSIRLLGTDLAVEVGAIRETSTPGETPHYSRYTVLHVKRDNKWLMAMARDTRDEPPTNHERLQRLAWLVGDWLVGDWLVGDWLVGDWLDDGGSSVVRTTCNWSPDGNFLIQEMTIQVAGQDLMQVTQRIGWDPLTKQIRSWVFDSKGGFGVGVWTRLDDSWVIKSTGVRAEGTSASATSVIVPTGRDGYVWRVHDRIIGDAGVAVVFHVEEVSHGGATPVAFPAAEATRAAVSTGLRHSVSHPIVAPVRVQVLALDRAEASVGRRNYRQPDHGRALAVDHHNCRRRGHDHKSATALRSCPHGERGPTSVPGRQLPPLGLMVDDWGRAIALRLCLLWAEPSWEPVLPTVLVIDRPPHCRDSANAGHRLANSRQANAGTNWLVGYGAKVHFAMESCDLVNFPIVIGIRSATTGKIGETIVTLGIVAGTGGMRPVTGIAGTICGMNTLPPLPWV